MRCRIVPLPDHQVSFLVDGTEKTRWHFAPHYPRPFFHPLIGPSGHTVTRMGHPGAPDHDHHRSVWFAHHKLLGIDFWSENTAARITQDAWLCYEDGDESARMAVILSWRDGHDPTPLIRQQLIATVRPLSDNEWTLELQSRFSPTAASIEFQQTNFGFLAVRVAKNISQYFGGGQLTNSQRQTGEPAIFGKPARWMDYSGPSPAGANDGAASHEGITYFDHPSNPGQPTKWHVRADGWMGASPCMDQSMMATASESLQVRYLLHIHAGQVHAEQADQLYESFAKTYPTTVAKSSKPHIQWQIQ